ncbi:MAG: 4-(cytidine 5'-diphospho)-2-C-methyl-D-erythritol kinase [Halanaerobium sp.]
MKIIESAQAKINLSLAIEGRYDDGYHKLNMIMQSVSLTDILEIEDYHKGIKLIMDSNLDLPTNNRNLIWQAADILINTYPEKIKGLKINLTKNIPIAAGLAGGSSNAAAVIRGVNRLYQLGLGWSEMRKLGASIGSDVPFCIKGGTAQVKGKGEIVEDLKPLKGHHAILINPGFRISTKKVFKMYANGDYEKKEIFTDKLINLIETETNITWKESWANQLEPVAFNMYPELEEVKQWVINNGALHAQLSGSGPTIIGFFNNKVKAEKVAEKWVNKGRAFVVEFTKGY